MLGPQSFDALNIDLGTGPLEYFAYSMHYPRPRPRRGSSSGLPFSIAFPLNGILWPPPLPYIIRRQTDRDSSDREQKASCLRARIIN